MPKQNKNEKSIPIVKTINSCSEIIPDLEESPFYNIAKRLTLASASMLTPEETKRAYIDAALLKERVKGRELGFVAPAVYSIDWSIGITEGLCEIREEGKRNSKKAEKYIA